MTCAQIAILLQLLGFVLASLTVALIKIQYIKRFLDKIKSLIIIVSGKIVRSKPDFDSVLADSFIRVSKFYRDLLVLIIKLPIIWYKILVSSTKLSLKLHFKGLGQLLWHYRPTYIFTLSLPLILAFIIPWTVLWVLVFLLLKLHFVLFSKISSSEFFTTTAIIIGTLLVLAGLAMELALAF